MESTAASVSIEHGTSHIDPTSSLTLSSAPDGALSDHQGLEDAMFAVAEEGKGFILDELEGVLKEGRGLSEEVAGLSTEASLGEASDRDRINGNEEEREGEEQGEQAVAKAAEAYLEQVMAEVQASPEPEFSTGESEPRNEVLSEPYNPVLPSVSNLAPLSAVAASVRAQKDEVELTWCCICNDDATYRCDDDLYCNKCLAEYTNGWDEEERRESPATPFKPRQQHQ